MAQGYTGFINFPELSQEAQQEELHQILSTLKSMGTNQISCWLAEQNADQTKLIQATCKSLEIGLVGAIFPALVFDSTLRNTGCLIKALPDTCHPRLISCENQPADAIADKVAQLDTIPSDTPPGNQQANLFLVFDAQQPNISDILDQLYLKLHKSVRYSGANAGSETFQPMACLFDSDRQIGYGLWALLYNTEFDTALAHGYKNFEPITATSTTGNRIHSINWRNAFEVYQEEIFNRYQQKVTADNFYDYATHFPFGIMRMAGQPLVRIPVAVEDDGTLVCVGDIPEHTVISLLQGVKADGTETLDLLAHQLKKPAPDYQVFYCAGRRMHLGKQADHELKLLSERFPNTHLSGALSLGEICNDEGQGYPLFHNAAIVCCPWL